MPKGETDRIGRDLAFELFEQEKRPSDKEVKALGLKQKTTYNYFQLWKKTKEAPQEDTEGSPEAEKGSPGKLGVNVLKDPKKVGGPAVEVGKITITPENWGMSQYGAIVILDTYNKTKRDLGYGGTIGDFLCDVCSFYRRIVNYEEVLNDQPTIEGRSSSTENGGNGLGQTAPACQG